MKRLIGLLIFVAMIAYAAELSREAQEVLRNGAKVKMTFRVTNSQKKVVTNANVRVLFCSLNNLAQESVFTTDTNGMCVVEGICSKRISCLFAKDEHYQTEYEHKLLASYPNPDVKDGKWQPWNPTIEITLKEKRNPVSMIAKQVEMKLPNKNEPFGFDFKIGDWVKPHGKGEQPDLLFLCNIEERGHILDLKAELFIMAAQPEEGVTINLSDQWSQFGSSYEAQEGGYKSQYYLVEDRTPSKILQKIELTQAEYLTFRSRIVRDDEGNIISSHYGKITSIEYGRVNTRSSDARVSFIYYFNPTPNDRNLESK